MATEVLDKDRSVAAVAADYRCGWHTVHDHVITVADGALDTEPAPVVVLGIDETRRGKAKYLGGVGTKVTGKTKRKFKPNLQTVRALIDGRVKRIKVSAKAIRMGLVVKPLKRAWKPQEGSPVEQPAAGAATGESAPAQQ